MAKSQCIIDSNIVFDLHFGGILPVLFELTHNISAPESIIAELQRPSGIDLARMGLVGVTLTSEQVRNVIQLSAQHTRASRNDLQAYVVACDLKAILLTGDDTLRRIANDKGVECHGTLWVLDEMIRQEVLKVRAAGDALRQIMLSGRRLPMTESQERLQQWNQ